MKVKRFLGFVVFLTVLMTLFCLNVFADNSVSINTDNTTLSFSKILYIDITNGDDTLGDGSISNPYKTVNKAFLNATDNCCVYIKASGTYTVPKGLQSIINPALKITYFVPAELRGRVTFDLVSTGFSTDQVQKQTTTFIGLRFIREKAGDTRVYEYWHDGADLNLEFQNCLFDSVNNIPSNYVIYTGRTGCTITNLNYVNCTFIPSFSANTNVNSSFKGSFINCAFLKSNFTTDKYNFCGCTFDKNYNITNAIWKNIGTGTNSDGTIANIGVYGGTYAWGYTATPQPSNQLKLVLEVNEDKQLSISEELSDNSEMDWTSSDSAIATIDENGKVKAFKSRNTVITCTSKDKSYTETINVLVVDLEYQLAVDLTIGDKCRLTVDDLANATNVTWSSYDTNIATVSAKGKVAAISEGLTYIVASDKDGKEIGRIYIRVRK
jgi:hypothetical protein